MRILYDSKKIEYKTPFGCIVQDQSCTIHVRIPKNFGTHHVYLCIDADGIAYSQFALHYDSSHDDYDDYAVTFSIQDCGLYFYNFRIDTADKSFFINKDDGGQTSIDSGVKWQLTCYSREFNISNSFKGKIMYQIFPDRFYQVGECDVSEKIKPFLIHKNKYDIPLYLPDINGVVQNNDFFGGNLKGIEAKLPYLKELNVGIIYLNPIFMAYSNHRYDTGDYMRIDPLLGTEKDFKELCDKAHELDMKIILDGVFSHTGSKSVYFDEDNTFGNGAFNSPKSPYVSWFQFEKYPDKFTSWWGITTLPCTDELDPHFSNFIIENDDSVLAHWMKLGADGYRLDVADELPDEFIKRLHRRVHQLKEDSLVIGEVWEDASNKESYGVRRQYFTNMELDSVMNYPFKNGIIDFIKGNISAKNLADIVMTIAENYPLPVLMCLMNSLSTHDTVRILTSLGVDGSELTKPQRSQYWMTPEQLEVAITMEKAAAFLQFVFPGNPCIYYGDEIGMQGFEDPFNRRYFMWENINNDMFNFYKGLTEIYATSEVLQSGTILAEECDNGTICITRMANGETLKAIVSNEESYRTNIPKASVITMDKGSYKNGILKLEKYGFVLLKEDSMNI